MRWVAFGAFGALALTFSIIGLLLKIRDDIDRMMFVPQPRDRRAMSRALGARFGARVAILDLPVVNRDVNGYGARVRTSVPPGLYVTEAHAFSFERIGGQDVCLMTRVPWELKPLQAIYLSRAKLRP